MPNLRSLQERGSWGFTKNAPGIYTGSLWPSVFTGTTPGRHGCYYNEQIRPGTYEVADFLGTEIRKEPFWNELSRAGKRVCIFDIPKTPVSRELNGVQIVDWGTHDADYLPCSWPTPLIDELQNKYGASSFRRCDWVMQKAEPERTLLKELLWRAETKANIAEELLERDSWDVFMMAFGESHCVGHQCWHVHDESHPKHSPELRRDMGDPVQEVYVALDQAVGRVLRHAGPETVVIVLCSHGMSTHYDATSSAGRSAPSPGKTSGTAESPLSGSSSQILEEAPVEIYGTVFNPRTFGQPHARFQRPPGTHLFCCSHKCQQRRNPSEPRRP